MRLYNHIDVSGNTSQLGVGGATYLARGAVGEILTAAGVFAAADEGAYTVYFCVLSSE